MQIWIMGTVREKRFIQLLEQKLTKHHFKHALILFRNYGCFISHHITNSLLWAVDKDKVNKVLDALQNFWDTNDIDLQSQKPNIRGLNPEISKNPFAVLFVKPIIHPKIDQLFCKIYKILGL